MRSFVSNPALKAELFVDHNKVPSPGALVLCSQLVLHLFAHSQHTMGLFNFNFSPTITSTTATADTSNTPQVVELQLNEERVTVPMTEAEGKTIAQLFASYSGDLGDISRISRFVAAGRIVDADSTPEAGVVYRGAISSESKG